MINKKITEWLYYESPLENALGATPYNDPKYLALNFPHRKNFCDRLIECPLEEYISKLIWIFIDKFPNQYSYIQLFQTKANETGNLIDLNTNNRKAQDIEPLEFTEGDEIFDYLLSLKIQFKTEQSEVFFWIEEAIKDKDFSKDFKGDITTYHLLDSPVKYIEVTQKYVLLNINQDSLE